jgi:hypothetical protein
VLAYYILRPDKIETSIEERRAKASPDLRVRRVGNRSPVESGDRLAGIHPDGRLLQATQIVVLPRRRQYDRMQMSGYRGANFEATNQSTQQVGADHSAAGEL